MKKLHGIAATGDDMSFVFNKLHVHLRLLFILAGIGLMSGLSGSATAAENDIVVFAAASTTDVVTTAAAAFEKQTGFTVIPSFAGSGTLARQIKEGAPANIFISANMEWLDYLAKEGLLQQRAPVEVASNQLVIIAPQDAVVKEPFKIEELPKLLEGKRLAIGNPAHVPVGTYTKAAFQSLDIWDKLAGKYVMLPNVRAVLTLVERAEVPFAVVYETDARRSKAVKIITPVPRDAYPEILYGMAILKDYDNHSAKLFFDFLRSDEGQEIFHKFGFITPGQ